MRDTGCTPVIPYLRTGEKKKQKKNNCATPSFLSATVLQYNSYCYTVAERKEEGEGGGVPGAGAEVSL